MQTDNIKFMIIISRFTQLCDWLFLPIGIIWLSLLYCKADVITAIISAILFYIIFQIFIYLADIIISILYLITMLLVTIFQKIKIFVITIHIAFFTAWAIIAYWFANINPQPEFIKPICLVLYAGITLPFTHYGQKRINTISELELTYITILKVAAFVSCIVLLLFNIDLYEFGTVFAISYLFGIPYINDAMEDYN